MNGAKYQDMSNIEYLKCQIRFVEYPTCDFAHRRICYSLSFLLFSGLV